MKRHILAWIVLATVAFGLPRQAFLTQWKAASGAFSPLDLNPLVWYKGDGDTVDSSGNDYTGTWRGTASYTNGVNGQAFAIGASESAVLSASAAGMSTTSGTICFWIMPNWINTDGETHYFAEAFGTGARQLLFFKGSTSVTAIYTDSTSRGSSSLSVWDDSWVFVTLIIGDNLLYVDGVLVADFSDGVFGAGSETLAIGDRQSGAGNSADSAIDDFMIFTNVLSTAEITQIYNYRE